MLKLVSLAALLVACATAPPPAPAPFPPAPMERPPRVEPSDPLAMRQFELDGDVLVLPFEATTPDDSDRGLALAQLVHHALEVMPHELFPVGLALDAQGQPRPLSEYRATSVRFVVGGRLTRTTSESGPLELTLWLMDRHTNNVVSRHMRVDLPRLLTPRNVLAELLVEVERGPSETQRADMTWYEDLDDARLGLAGALVRTLHRARHATGEDVEALVQRADREAPWSYLMALEVARHVLAGAGSGCEPAVAERIARVLSLNRHLPWLALPQALNCQLADALVVDGEARRPVLPAWAASSGAHCRVGAKALTSVASSRGPVAPTAPGAPGSAPPGGSADGNAMFVTGLGGLYRGESCDSSYAAMHHAPEDLGPPIVRASLELETAVYFYGQRDLPQSTRWFRRAAATAEGSSDKACLVDLLGAEAHLGLADLAIEEGRGEDLVTHLDVARTIAERCADTRMRGRIMNTEALFEQTRSRFDRSLELLAKAREVFASITDATNLAVVEANIGVTWLNLGNVARAVPHLLEALAGKRKVRSEGGVGVLLENLGVAELARGNGDAAAKYLEEALEHTFDHQTLATLHVQLARLALSRGKTAEAHTHMDAAKKSSLRVHSRILEAVIEQTKGAVEVEEGRHAAALGDFHEALTIRRELGDRAGEGVTLSLLMSVSERMEKPAVAILYGKLAVEAHQEVRESAGAIDPEAAREFLASRAGTYRKLADLLVSQGRLVEAERVLGLLKEDEAERWTRDAAPKAERDGIPLTSAERKLEAQYDKAADSVMRLGLEYSTLAAKWPRTPGEEKKLEELRLAVESANKVFADFLGTLVGQGEALRRGELQELKEGAGIGADLADIGQGHVAVYTLVADKALHLIVVSPDTQVARSVEIEAGHLNALVSMFRQTLQDPTRDPRPAGKALWDVVLAPIERDLAAANAKTILWSLDQALRYVPIGALHDGRRWALERWSMAVFTPASKARLKDSPQTAWRVLALGVSAAHPPFPALPAVIEELAGLVDVAETDVSEGVLPGLKALDQDFTKALLLQQLTRKWPVVHLASHFSFAPGDKDASYLLLGDGTRLTVGELERMPNLFQGVDLLTLSACNTATGDVGGDGSEVESFAVLAQRKGARAVFASLWPVADQSTSALMRRFYALRGEAPTKLGALRQAQLELSSGKLVPTPGTTRARPMVMPGAPPREEEPIAPPNKIDPALAGWRHPYYWAPFILVGNTL